MKLITFIPVDQFTRSSYKAGLSLSEEVRSDLEDNQISNDVAFVLRNGNVTIERDSSDLGKSASGGATDGDSIRKPSKFMCATAEEGSKLNAGYEPLNEDELVDADEQMWVAVESFSLPLDMDVVLAYLPLEECSLVCLKKGAIKYQTTEDGDEIELMRGIDGLYEDTAFSSASNGNFEGMPGDDPNARNYEMYRNSFMTCTLRRERISVGGVPSLKTSFRPIMDSCHLLDNGEFFEAEKAAKAAAEEEARRKREEEARWVNPDIDHEAEFEAAKAKVFASDKAKANKNAKGSAQAVAAVTASGRMTGADALLRMVNGSK